MDQKNIVWTVVAVIIVVGLIWLASTRSDLNNGQEQDLAGSELPSKTTPDGVPDELPPEILAKVLDASAVDTVPISETVQVTLKTNKGDIEIELYGADAPNTVGNFVKLAQMDFYDNLTFHRVIPGFMIQGGDPLSYSAEFRPLHGTGGLGYIFDDEINDRKLVRGSVAMANGGPNTNGSQFFIVTAENVAYLDGKHTNFGQVISGMDVVDAISQVPVDTRDNPIDSVEITDVIVK